MTDMTHERDTTMAAVVHPAYGPVDVLTMSQITRPSPGEGEVLVRVRAAGVDPSVWHLTEGTPYPVRLAFGLRKPKRRVQGQDFAGEVVAVGSQVATVGVGDEVFGTCRGAFAEYAVARPDRIALKPAGLTHEQAAIVPISGTTALQAVRDSGQVQPGQSVLVIGAGGGVGTFAVQIAKALGAEVTGVCSTPKVDLVRSLGADHVVDYTQQDVTESATRYDVIIDTAGNRTLATLRRILQPRGTLVIVGGEGGGRWLGGLDRIIGASLLSPFVKQRLRALLASDNAEHVRTLSELVEAGSVTPVLDRTFPLSEAVDALRYVRQGHARGKVALTV